MLKLTQRFLCGIALLAFFPVALSAQTYLYTNNDVNDAVNGNSVYGYVVDTNGTLSNIGGTLLQPYPFWTGGSASVGGFGLFAATRIIIVNNFLYASNSGSNNVSAFTISANGFLTPVSGSPFPTGSLNNSGAGSGISLAATPDGRFLYAGSTGLQGQITIYSIDATTGALTIAGNSPIAADGPMSSLKVSPDGNYLVAPIPSANELSIYVIRKNGSLREPHGSPYALTYGAATSVDFNCAGNLLYAGGSTGYIYAFNFSRGKLSPVTDPPFNTGFSTNRVVTLSSDGGTLYSSNQTGNAVSAFAVGPNGGLMSPGITVNAAGTSTVNPYPGGLAVSSDGSLLFAADQNATSTGGSGFSIFSLPLYGSSSLISLTPTGLASGLHSLAVYPPKVCTAPAAAIKGHH